METFDAPRPQGHPSWFDLMSPDVERAAAFYERVFGWSYDRSGPELGHYHTGLVDGRAAAGIGQIPEGAAMPSAWTVYFAADDADAMARRAQELGGAVLQGPFDVGEAGRMAVVRDPTGAAFGLWQGKEHHGAGIAQTHGAMAWCEVHTPDAEAARAFYGALLGADTTPMEGAPVAYHTIDKDGAPHGGIQGMDEDGAGPPRWLTYFLVDDADAAAAAIEEAGGALSGTPFDSPHGRIVFATDPFGAAFGLVQPPAAMDRTAGRSA